MANRERMRTRRNLQGHSMNLFLADLQSRVDDAIRRNHPQPVLSACVCGSQEIEPYLERCNAWSEMHEVTCEACERSVSGPSREIAIQMWRAVQTERELVEALQWLSGAVRALEGTAIEYPRAMELSRALKCADALIAERTK